MFDPDPRSALAVPVLLVRRFGALGLASILAEVGLRLWRGEPFGHLPPARDAEERDSRRQAAPAFVLHRVLTRRGVADPLGLVGEIVELAGQRFLAEAIGPIRREAIAGMGPDERQRWVESRARRFPNARPDFEEVSARGVRFRIHHCRFVALAHQIGEPSLATVFCRADERYFGGVEPGVALVRPHTLAQGGPDCPFELRFADR